ncbi:DUF11 domain-containing protein [Candidatus Gracilibacteria bacterium]|nr:DUF11 domain-containing protein [Candidatus Gracilibacteria bacterium]NJM87677.1 DUF11 domain-containing protein [Hydrococcus sp. RU_2_2]NJP19391.1 DUF11 domain-containing protein [Hydrococcus sp. CRU_1_1]
MKRWQILSLGIVALTASVAVASEVPVVKNLRETGTQLVQNIQEQKPANPLPAAEQQKSLVELELAAQKQVVARNEKGERQINWQPLAQNNTVVQPGDVIRYMVTSKNISDRAVSNLVVTQPIPPRTMYVPNSATLGIAGNVEVTYSIDGGKAFVAQPTIQVKQPDGTVETRPAPVETYTHVRWKFPEALNPTVALNSSYQVKVR